MRTPKVGVALAAINVVTLGLSDEIHSPLTGLVWQRDTFSGKDASPVSTEAVMIPVVPTLTVATANTAVSLVPGTFAMPGSGGSVADKATMSGTGPNEAENSNVFRPVLMGAGFVFEQSKLNRTSVGEIGELGLKVKTKV